MNKKENEVKNFCARGKKTVPEGIRSYLLILDTDKEGSHAIFTKPITPVQVQISPLGNGVNQVGSLPTIGSCSDIHLIYISFVLTCLSLFSKFR